jgi:hypothetical protein
VPASHSEQQAAQSGLALIVAQDLEGVWPHATDQDRLTLLVHALTTKYGRISGALAGRFYRQVRADVGLGPRSVKVADPAPLEQVAKTLGWATHDKSGQPLALEAAKPRIEAATAKLVQDVGRDTIVGTVHDDPEARGWARLTEPNPCYFCALLAARGGVYTRQTASFKSHDHCECIAFPEFTRRTADQKAAFARAAQWDVEYRKATKGAPRGQLLQAWRRHYDANVRPAQQPV